MNSVVRLILGVVFSAIFLASGSVSAGAPTTLKMAAILTVGGEEPWDA